MKQKEKGLSVFESCHTQREDDISDLLEFGVEDTDKWLFISSKRLNFMYTMSDRIAHTTTFDTPVVEQGWDDTRNFISERERDVAPG